MQYLSTKESWPKPIPPPPLPPDPTTSLLKAAGSVDRGLNVRAHLSQSRAAAGCDVEALLAILALAARGARLVGRALGSTVKADAFSLGRKVAPAS